MSERSKKLGELQRFLEDCSDVSLSDLVLAKFNSSANNSKEYRQHVQTLLEGMLKLMDFADAWAQSEAEARYVNLIREANRQRREKEALTFDISAQSVTKT